MRLGEVRVLEDFHPDIRVLVRQRKYVAVDFEAAPLQNELPGKQISMGLVRMLAHETVFPEPEDTAAALPVPLRLAHRAGAVVEEMVVTRFDRVAVGGVDLSGVEMTLRAPGHENLPAPGPVPVYTVTAGGQPELLLTLSRFLMHVVVEAEEDAVPAENMGGVDVVIFPFIGVHQCADQTPVLKIPTGCDRHTPAYVTASFRNS